MNRNTKHFLKHLFVGISLVWTLTQCHSSDKSSSSAEYTPFIASATDSLKAAEHYNNLNSEFFNEDDEDFSPSGLDEGFSILGLGNTPLRIYSVTGEFCGAYCNPFYSNLIIWEDWQSEQSLGVVDSVFALDPHHIGILSSGWGRPAGYYTITFQSFAVLEHGLDSIPQLVPVNPSTQYEEDYLFAVSTPHYLDPDPRITFSNDTLAYQYGMDLLNWENQDTCYRVEGAYYFSEGVFEEVYEERTIISREDF